MTNKGTNNAYQYFKKDHTDAILFFRLGDFYEAFYEDANTCVKVCGLTLNRRIKGKKLIPLVSVSCHAANGYFKKMSQAGYKIVLLEQIAGRQIAKSIAPTPPTICR